MRNSLALALFAVVAAATTARAQCGLKQVQLSVAATNDEWSGTTVTVEAGDLIVVLPEGQVRIGQWLGTVGPSGSSTGEGALQWKIGTGAPELLGSRRVVMAPSAGELKFRVSDTRYSDNSGEFSVVVLVVPAAAIPPMIVVRP